MSRRHGAAQQLEDAYKKVPPPEPAEADAVIETAEDDTTVVVTEAPADDDPLVALQRNYDALKADAEKQRSEADALRTQAAEAMRHADAYRRRAEESQTEVRKTAVAAIDSAIANTATNITTLKAEIARAASVNDWETFAEAQEALAQNVAHMQSLRENKARTEADRPPQRRAEEGADESERFISTLTERSAAWVRQHKGDIFSSTQRQNKAQAAHFMAVADGLAVDSDAYFAQLDKYMGYTENVSPPPDPVPDVTQQRQHGMTPSAPPARTVPGQSTSRNNEMRLTAEQQKMALQIFSDRPRADALALYAKNLREIQNGGTNLELSNNKYRGGYRGI